jgi:zinc protease
LHRLTQELREGKGYTYGIGSSSVPTTKVLLRFIAGYDQMLTYESVRLIKEIVEQYGTNFNENDNVTKDI